jgi:hypothetical protein
MLTCMHRAHAPQELVKKLTTMVGKPPAARGSSGSGGASLTQPVVTLPQAATTPAAFQPNVNAVGVWDDRVSLSRVDALATIQENLPEEVRACIPRACQSCYCCLFASTLS